MNYLSLNIRGVRDEAKSRWVRKLILTHKINFLCLQETQMEDGSKIRCGSFWNSVDYESEYVDSVGRSGGMLCIWNNSLFSKLSVIKNRYFLVIKGTIKGSNQLVNVVNVYGPRNVRARRSVWSELADVMEDSEGAWILIGDYNAVRVQEERLNSGFDPVCANALNDFIVEAGLYEFAMSGQKYTYCKSKSRKMSKIDRCLVNQEFVDLWADSCFMALPRFLFDHSPIVLVTNPFDYGPVPFRVFNSWMEDPGFDSVVREAASSFAFEGPPDVYLAEKFKFLKAKIKQWAKGKKSKDNEEYDKALNDLMDLEGIMEVRPLEEEEEWIRLECLKSLSEMDRRKTSDLFQKSRSKWASYGDENTAFFHRIIKHKATTNKIHGLEINGRWCTVPSRVKKEIFSHFRDRFKEPNVARPKILGGGFKVLSVHEADVLVIPFSKTEIKLAVWDCGDNKARGPDGFNFKFIKRFWDVLELDFLRLFEFFHQSEMVNNACVSSFIALVPKFRDAAGTKDFRPINLIGVISKVISKVLANRLKGVLNSVVSLHQSAFIAGRFILDGPLMVNEIMAWWKKNKKKGMLFKLDFEKAYDHLNWDFLDSILEIMGFPTKWRGWIKGIVSSARSSVLVNGSPTFEFKYHRGLRQGDPISPFLFVLAMEAFSVMISNSCSNGFF